MYVVNMMSRNASWQIVVKFPEGSLEKVPEDTFLLAILDEHWPEFLEERRCSVRDELNRWKIELSPEQTKNGEATFNTSIRQVKKRLCHLSDDPRIMQQCSK